MKTFINGKVLFNGKFEEMTVSFEENIESFNRACGEEIDVTGYYVVPGFIDTHIHGMNGYDVMNGTKEALYNISKSLPQFGTTSFLATTMTMDKKSIDTALNNVKSFIEVGDFVAEPMGVHLEGPFISKDYKGAQNPDYIIQPDLSLISGYSDLIKLITYAPEEDMDNRLLDFANKNDIVMSIGHSNATYDRCKAVIDSGVKSITHLFNAMRPMNHREPGVVGAAFIEDVYTELIADKIHVSPVLFNMIYRQKGQEKLLLITDAMEATCLKCGTYSLGGQDVVVDETSARLKNGQLAGSILTQNMALKNFLDSTGLPLEIGVGFLTVNPAQLLKLEDRGVIDIGKRADFTILDENLEVKMTFVKGKRVY